MRTHISRSGRLTGGLTRRWARHVSRGRAGSTTVTAAARCAPAHTGTAALRHSGSARARVCDSARGAVDKSVRRVLLQPRRCRAIATRTEGSRRRHKNKHKHKHKHKHKDRQRSRSTHTTPRWLLLLAGTAGATLLQSALQAAEGEEGQGRGASVQEELRAAAADLGWVEVDMADNDVLRFLMDRAQTTQQVFGPSVGSAVSCVETNTFAANSPCEDTMAIQLVRACWIGVLCCAVLCCAVFDDTHPEVAQFCPCREE